MAFNRSPTEDTFSEQTVHLTREINARDGGTSGKDEDLINVFIERIKNKQAGDDRHFVVKRSGTIEVIPSVSAEAVRGLFFWEDESKVLYCVNNDIYVYDVNAGTSTTLTNVFSTTSGDVGFALFLYDTGVAKVVATDGTTLLTIDNTNTVVTGSDPDMPVHLPYPIFLDGYLFIVKSNTADIYNSNLNDPLLYTAGDFITAEMEGDKLLRIAKINNYIAAMGSGSIEYFWDAGNATGSPLQRNDTPIKLNTYLAGFAQFGNSLYYIGLNESGQPDIYMLKDFRIEEMGTPTISRYLNSANNNINAWTAGIVSCKGHTFYIVNVGTTKTYVLDVDTKLWTSWAYQQTSRFNIQVSTGIKTSGNALTYFALGTSSSAIYKFNDSLFQDNGITFTCTLVTEASSFGTLNRKTMPKLSIIADRPSIDANVDVYWSDDDYQTYNGPRSINLNQDLPCTYNLGWFRQRNFKLVFTSNENLRLQDLEVQINKGR
jgi:hypothetical protein